MTARIATNALDVLGLAGVAFVATALSEPGAPVFAMPLGQFQISLEDDATLIWVVSLLAVLFTAKSVLGAFLLRVSTLFLANLDARQSRKITDYLFGGELTRFSNLSRGELNWSIMKSSQNAFSSILFSLGTLIAEGTLLLAVAGFLFLVNPGVAAGLFFYFILVGAMFMALGRSRTSRLGKRFEENSAQGHELLDGITNTFRESRMAGRTSDLIDWLFTYRNQQARDWAGQRFLLALPRYIVELALVLGVLSLSLVAIAFPDVSPAADVVVILVGGLRLMASLLPVQTASTELRLYLPQGMRALQILEKSQRNDARELGPMSEEEYGHNPNTISGNGSHESGIEAALQNLWFAFPTSEDWVLKDINVTVKPGQHHAITGPSGAGKSTLVDCLLGLEVPQRGGTFLNRIESRDFIRNNPGAVGYVPQKPGFIPGTLLENISLNRSGSRPSHKAAMRAAKIAGLEEFVESLPKGLHTRIDGQLDGLSGGQLQRLAIARAIYSSPRLLVLDEPTSALDANTEASISNSIQALTNSMTVITIAHRVNSMQKADVIHFIAKGHLEHSGTFKELRRKNSEFDNFVRLLSNVDLGT